VVLSPLLTGAAVLIKLSGKRPRSAARTVPAAVAASAAD
jgi:hypothetical protein